MRLKCGGAPRERAWERAWELLYWNAHRAKSQSGVCSRLRCVDALIAEDQIE